MQPEPYQEPFIGSQALLQETCYTRQLSTDISLQNQSSSKAQSGGLKSGLELAKRPGQPHHPCFIYNKAWLHLPLYQHGCFWKYQKLFTGTLQTAARACSNHQTTPPVSPAKRGAVMSPLHEGSVNDMSRCTGWHTNCTCSTRTGE